VNSHFGAIRVPAVPVDALPPAEDARLREALRHCSSATYYAAYQFHLTGDASRLPAVVDGIIARYVETGRRASLANPDGSLRLSEDLGLDSLTMVEIAAAVEDVLGVSLADDDLSHLRTLGGVRELIRGKVRDQRASP